MTYTDVFGNNTLPPAEYGYASFNLTTDSTFVWPYNSSNAAFTVAKVMDMTCSAGVSLVLPNATEVSTGEDFMVRNVGSETLTIKDASGTQVTQVLPGAATYFYLTSNATPDGLYGVIAFGVGTSSVDAASLVGYGVKAIGSSLNQSHPVVPTNTGITLGDDHRSKLVVFTGGVTTFSLTSAAVLGDDYFTLFRNDGTGTVTLTAYSGDYIDGMASMQVQPGESLILVCAGTQWFTVGYGRSVLYQFTQLTKDVSAGGTITLTATEASNKLITFVGNPSSAVSVVVPATVAVYYTQSAISTAQTITLKTASGSGTGITQGSRIIALCDGTNVVSAQSAVANASVSLTDGSVSIPSLFFATQTNTGLYKDGTKSLGVAVEGVSVGVFGPNGLQTATLGPNSTQRHTVPAVPSDTISLLNTTQTVTNKTFNLSNNTLTGTTAQFNTALSDGDFATLAGVEVLTNKTISGANNTLSNIGNASLTNSSITINGNAVSLGGTTTVTATASNALTIGTGLSGTSYNGSTPVTVAIDSTVATLTGTQTLTNKTLTNPSFSGATADMGSVTTIDINGGTIDGTVIGGTTPAAGSFTSLTDSGNLSFTGTGNRITGDFSNATVANRVMFQTSTVNSATVVGVIPNGTGTIAQFAAYGGSDPSNAQVMRVDTRGGAESRIESTYAGTPASGTYLPMTFYTGGSERMRIDTSGNVGIGSAPTADLSVVKAKSADGVIGTICNNSTSVGSYAKQFVIQGSVVGSMFAYDNAVVYLGTESAHPVILRQAGNNRLLLDTSGNTLHTTPNGGLGYGTGAGGTVTQATSKATAVALNKPTGKITMNNAALAAGARAGFQCNNSLVTVNDTVVASIDHGSAPSSGYNYSVVASASSGAIVFVIKNDSAGSLSEAVVINFAIIKGAAS